MIITFNYLKFCNKWYFDKKKKKEENDSINHETMLSKYVCYKNNVCINNDE